MNLIKLIIINIYVKNYLRVGDKMKAMGFYENGTSNVIKQIEIDTPVPAPDQILIKLKMTSVNTLDLMVRRGVPGMNIPFPHVPGTDVYGTIEAVGSNVKKFYEGEKVISNTVYGCGSCKYCISGHEQLCPSWKCFGLHINGSYGEFITVPERIVSKAPSNFTDEEIAAMPLHASLAWRNIKGLGNATEGETIVVLGATGNVGLFAIKFSKALGLKTIALTRSDEKMQKLRAIGADFVIKQDNATNIIKEVMEITNGVGADIIINSMGNNLGDTVEMAAYNARIISFGVLAGATSSLNVRRLYLRNISIFGTHNASKSDLDNSIEFAKKKNIKPIIYKSFDIGMAAQAQDLLESSKAFGKIILKHWR